MLQNNQGSTLITTLFAFSIYISTLILFMSLLTSLRSSTIRLQAKQQQNQVVETETIVIGDPLSCINAVLH